LAAAESSFDVVSEFDRQELVNTLDQTRREIQSRFDFKGSKTEITLEDKAIQIHTDGDYRLNAIKDILQSKAIKRGLSLKTFKFGDPEPASGSSVRQRVELIQGIPDDIAKKIVKQIRDSQLKVRTQIQGEALRVFSKSKDDLQSIMQLLREQDYPVDLQFTNRR